MLACVREGRRELRRRRGDPAVLTLIAGVLAFLLTCVTGHPLLFAEVAYPFWIALGVLAGWSLRGASGSEHASPAADSGDVRRFTRLGLVAAMTIIVAVGSIPPRVSAARQGVNFDLVEYGFHGWETEPSGRRYRWTRDRAATFLPTGTRGVTLALQALPTARTPSFEVELRVDGRPVDRVTLGDSVWRPLDIRLPPVDDERRRRFELHVSPVWTPSAVMPGSTDQRRLGVKVSELAVTTTDGSPGSN